MLLSYVAILDSLQKENTYKYVTDNLSRWLISVCEEKSPRKPKIVTVQAQVTFSILYSISMS